MRTILQRHLLPLAAIAALGLGLFAGSVSAPAAESTGQNEIARYLAGLQPAAGSPVATFTNDPAWRQHAAAFDQAWGRFEKAQLSRIRAWRGQHLTSHRPTLLYFFSGPDYLYADAFFPEATTYVLAGLEPIGPIPQVTAANRGALPALRASLNSVLNLSFFRTREMRQRLSGGAFAGTLPLLYIFLARAGKTVEAVSLVRLNADGVAGPAEGPAARGEVNGVKIVFTDAASGMARSAGTVHAPAAAIVGPAKPEAIGSEPSKSDAKPVEGKPIETGPVEPNPVEAKPVEAKPETAQLVPAPTRRTLYYFQGDVSNAGPGLDALQAFCRALGPADGFVKSASYLMHIGGFSKIRDFLLAQTQLILEDDSGIPAQYFSPGSWDLSPYGRYLGPISLFPGRRQRQLDDLYKSASPRPLDFGIGYRFHQNESNLLLAVKRPQ